MHYEGSVTIMYCIVAGWLHFNRKPVRTEVFMTRTRVDATEGNNDTSHCKTLTELNNFSGHRASRSFSFKFIENIKKRGKLSEYAFCEFEQYNLNTFLTHNTLKDAILCLNTETAYEPQ